MLDKLKTENEHIDKFLHMSHFLSINFNTMLNKALLNPHEDSHVHAACLASTAAQPEAEPRLHTRASPPPTMRLLSRIVCLVCLALVVSRLVIARATAEHLNIGARAGGSVVQGGCGGGTRGCRCRDGRLAVSVSR